MGEPNDKLATSDFEQIFTQFLDEKSATHTHLFLRKILKFDVAKQTVTLKLSQAFNEDINNKFMYEMAEILELLESLNFEGLECLKIRMDDFESQIEFRLMDRIAKSFNNLKNLKKIQILDSQFKLNPWKLYLFLQIEISTPNRRISFTFDSIELEIQIISYFNEQKQKQIQQLKISEPLSFTLNPIYKSFNQINKLIKLFEALYSMSLSQQSQLMNLSDGQIIYPKQQLTKKQKQLSFSFKEWPLKQQFSCIYSLLKMWEKESDKITSITFKINSCQSNMIETDIDLSCYKEFDDRKFLELPLLSKLKVEYPDVIAQELDFLFNLIQSVKGIVTTLPSLSTEDNLKLETFSTQLKEIKLNQSPTQLTKLCFPSIFQDQVNNILQIALQLPKLQKLQVLIEVPRIRIIEQLKKCLILVARNVSLNLSNCITFYKDRLRLVVTSKQEKLDLLSTFIPKILFFYLGEKAVHLELSIIMYSVQNPKKDQMDTTDLIKQIISVPNVVNLTFRNLNSFPNCIQKILMSRNSIYNSVLAYQLRVAQFMTFNPKIILLDLVEQ